VSGRAATVGRMAWPLSDRAAALIEQALVSGANFVAFVFFARTLDAAAWGSFGFAYALLLFVQGFQRALVTIPMIPFSAAAGWDASRITWARTSTLLVLAAVVLPLLAAGVVALAGGGWLLQALLMAALMAPCVFAHEFARRAAVQERRFGTLAGMGAAYAAVMVLAALVVPPSPSVAWTPALAFAASAALSALLYRGVARLPLLPRPGRPGQGAGPGGAESYPQFAAWATASHLGYSGYNFGVQAILAVLAGPAALGVFHACRTLVQPVAVLTTAMDGIDKPRAAAALQRGGWPAMRAALVQQQGRVALPALPFLALVALAAEPILHLLYADVYAGQQAAVWAWCAVTLGAMLAQPVESGLYVARRTRQLFFARAAAAAAGLAAALVLVPLHGAAGALAAMALGFGVAAALGAWHLVRSFNKHST
jgi:O-antigen/teichoic acid export membrane protein